MKTLLALRQALRSLEESEGDLGASERLVLVQLLQGDALPSELADDLVLSRGRLSHILHQLEKKGYIQTTSLERDRRSKRVSLTTDGRPLARAAEEALRGQEVALRGDLGEAELLLLQQMLARIAS